MLLITLDEHHIQKNVMVTNVKIPHRFFVVSSTFIRGQRGGGPNLPGGVSTNQGVLSIKKD